MAYGILFLRVVLGLTMAGHGAQKLFGWWGGPGLHGVHGWLGGLRFRGGWLPVALIVGAEFGGGVVLALGLFTPIAALAVATAMVVAVALAHWRNGFWNGAGGFEFNLLIIASAVALAATGGARFSIDNALGWADNLSGLWWGVGVLGVAALGAFLLLTVGRRPETPAVESQSTDEEQLRAA